MRCPWNAHRRRGSAAGHPAAPRRHRPGAAGPALGPPDEPSLRRRRSGLRHRKGPDGRIRRTPGPTPAIAPVRSAPSAGGACACRGRRPPWSAPGPTRGQPGSWPVAVVAGTPACRSEWRERAAIDAARTTRRRPAVPVPVRPGRHVADAIVRAQSRPGSRRRRHPDRRSGCRLQPVGGQAGIPGLAAGLVRHGRKQFPSATRTGGQARTRPPQGRCRPCRGMGERRVRTGPAGAASSGAAFGSPRPRIVRSPIPTRLARFRRPA